jgi:hypothetical protein
VEAKLFGFLFQRGDQAFVETDRGTAFPADDVVMVMVGLLGKIEGLASQDNALDQTGFAEGLQYAVDGGPVADI